MARKKATRVVRSWRDYPMEWTMALEEASIVGWTSPAMPKSQARGLQVDIQKMCMSLRRSELTPSTIVNAAAAVRWRLLDEYGLSLSVKACAALPPSAMLRVSGMLMSELPTTRLLSDAFEASKGPEWRQHIIDIWNKQSIDLAEDKRIAEYEKRMREKE